MQPYKSPVVIEPTQPANQTVIWLHGLGADGHDFVPIAAELQFRSKSTTRFIFPHAQDLPVTINNGYIMPAWFDILDTQIDRIIDTPQLKKSSSYIHSLISQQIETGIASTNIILAGFSQGGAVALDAGLEFSQKLGGLMILSSYFATADNITPAPANAKIPILIQHGLQDPIVPEQLGRESCGRLQKMGYQVQYQTYPMPHSVCPQQVADIGQWLDASLPPPQQS